jgi:GNAT superfamily N-acetyltransferase
VGTCWPIAQELDARHDLTPWPAVLYVVPDARGRGVARALVAAVEAAAREAGFARLHLYTHGPESFYARVGWRTAERFDDGGEPACPMSRDL